MTNNVYTLSHQEIFNHPIIRTNCKTVNYQDIKIEIGLHKIFNSNRVKNFKYFKTSCTIPTSLSDIYEIDGIGDLINWIQQSIIDNAHYFGKSESKSVEFIRGWTNRSFEHSQNNCHLHVKKADGVAVFYQRVPQPNSSQLVLVRGGTNETPLDMYPATDLFNIEVKSGDLILHHSSIPHGISTHKNPNPRTCLAFDFILK